MDVSGKVIKRVRKMAGSVAGPPAMSQALRSIWQGRRSTWRDLRSVPRSMLARR